MSTPLGIRRTLQFVNDYEVDTAAAGTPVDGSAGDLVFFAPSQPVDIIRWGFVVHTVLVIDSGGLDLSLDFRPTIASDTDRVEKDTIAVLDADDPAAGTGVYSDLSEPLHVDPGEQVVIELVDAATSGDVIFFIEFLELPFVGGSEGQANSRIANMIKR